MPVIEVEDLIKRYDGVPVVDRVSFDVERGEIFAILGPNGAGKTTTVESNAGLRRPDGGRISVLGLDPAKDVDDLRKVLGTNREVAERLFISEATVKTHLLHIYAELGVNDRAAAVGAAFERGLLTPGPR
jgi:ABC-2 type transport system ATP-binding protein